MVWHHPIDPKEKDTQLTVAEFLVRLHFTVAVSEEAKQGQPMICATAPACQMLVASSPPLGWDRDMIRHYATDADRIFLVFRGRVYAEQPTWRTASDYLWSQAPARARIDSPDQTFACGHSDEEL